MLDALAKSVLEAAKRTIRKRVVWRGNPRKVGWFSITVMSLCISFHPISVSITTWKNCGVMGRYC